MPKRPNTHVIADQAIGSVIDTVAKAGYVAEVVSKDYGEDLLVQTSHAGRMDASRLWVQVKGTADIGRHRRKNGDCSFSVSYDHALRWCRSSDLVAVVLWDVTAADGWFARPQRQVDTYIGFVSGQRTTTLRFPRHDSFNPQAVRRLALESRIDHYRYLVLSARNVNEDRERLFEQAPTKMPRLLAFEFLILVGMIERVTESPDTFLISDCAKERFADCCAWVAAEESEDPEAIIYRGAIKAIVSYADVEVGLPSVLIEEGVAVLLGILGEEGLLNALST